MNASAGAGSSRLTRWLRAAGGFLLLAAAFSVAYTQAPLYSSNQNQYFLHGLARAGLGFLRQDWLANTLDPCPVFTSLVYVTCRFLHECLFYLYYAVLFGVYAYAMWGIVLRIFKAEDSPVKRLLFLAIIMAIHSRTLDHITGGGLAMYLHTGVAGQYILWKIFQPSSFGVFIILSIYLFLRQRAFLSVLCLAVAVTLHFTYILGAAVLIVTYMGVICIAEKNLKKALLLAAFAAVLLAPVTVYVLTHFGPTSREAWGRAQDILANVQLPRHAKPANWLGTGAGVKVALIVLALGVVRETRLFPVMLVSLLVGLTLTVVQIITGSNSLAMLFPWRVSVYLVPISTCVLGCWIGSRIWDRLCRDNARNVKRIARISWAAIAVFVLTGLIGMALRPCLEKKDGSAPVMDFVKKTKASGDTYLVPVEMHEFRLRTGAPIVADRISIPYRDLDVIEWYNRYLAARGFYGAKGPADKALKRIADEYKATHVVIKEPAGRRAEGLKPLYEDEKYAVYKIER